VSIVLEVVSNGAWLIGDCVRICWVLLLYFCCFLKKNALFVYMLLVAMYEVKSYLFSRILKITELVFGWSFVSYVSFFESKQ
jgi:hypothetical protein